MRNRVQSARMAWSGAAGWILLVVVGAVPAGALPPELEQAFEFAKGHFRPVTAARVAEARDAVVQSAAALERLLRSGELTEDEATWKEYLHWKTLQEQLKAEQPDARALGRTAVRLYRHKEGLHLKPFTEFRDRLVDWINLEVAARQKNLKQTYLTRLDQLKQLCEQLEADPSDAATAERIGALLGFIQRTGQDVTLVDKVRAALWHDNLYAEVSSKLASAGIEEPIDEKMTIRDCIMGTSIEGTAHTTGTVKLATIPCEDRAVLRLLVDGEAASENTGWQRGVTIWSNSLTTLAAEMDVLVSGDRFDTSVVKAGAATSTNVYALSARSCFVEKIAWRRVAKTKWKAEEEASAHAAERLAGQVEERVTELLGEAEQGFDEKFRAPLLRRGEWPSRLQFASTDKSVSVRFLQANVTQPAATIPMPKVAQGRDLVVRLHETFIANFSRAILGNWTLTDERLVKLLSQFGDIPEELKTSPDKAPWSITFSATKPVSATFRDGKVEFAIFGRRFEQGSNYIESPIRLSATYRVTRTKEGARLVRDGDVVVKFTRLKRLGPTQIALRTVMRAKFEALFKPEFETKGLELPGRWEKAGDLHLEELVANQGWLALSWTMKAKPAASQTASADDAVQEERADGTSPLDVQVANTD